MTTFIKTKFKISDLESPSNFQVKEKKYLNRSRNNEIGLLWSWQSFGESTILDFESPSNFQVKEKKYLNWSRNNEIGLLWSRQSFGEYQIWNPHQISKSRKKKIFKSVQKQRNYALIKNPKVVIFKIDILKLLYF